MTVSILIKMITMRIPLRKTTMRIRKRSLRPLTSREDAELKRIEYFDYYNITLLT